LAGYALIRILASRVDYMSNIQALFSVLIILQCALIVLHDQITIPGLNNARAVRRVIGARKFWIATVSTAIFPTIAAALALASWGHPAAHITRQYWVLYCAVTVASALFMWWIPYFRGADAETSRQYREMYQGTAQLLPARGDNPRPNTLHIAFHVLFIGTLALSIVLVS
jgi:hypothetical protein